MWSNPGVHVTPEYLAEDNSGRLLRVSIAFLVVETIFIVLLYAARIVSTEKKKTNWAMIIMMTGAYTVCISKIVVALLEITIGGAGRHPEALSAQTREIGMKLNLAMQIACPTATSMTKLSVLILFYGILGRTSRRYRIVIRCISGVVVTMMITQFIIPMTNCKPFSYNWNRSQPGSCTIPSIMLWRYLGIPNVITTVMVFIIPVPALYKLKVSTATKAGLVFVFAVCLAGVTAAFMRFLAFVKRQNFNDASFDVTPLCWTIAESGIYLVAGVLPTLRPLVRKVCGEGVFDRITGSLKSSKGPKNQRWSRMVLRGENAVKTDTEIRGAKASSDTCTEVTIVEVDDQEKGRVSKGDSVRIF